MKDAFAIKHILNGKFGVPNVTFCFIFKNVLFKTTQLVILCTYTMLHFSLIGLFDTIKTHVMSIRLTADTFSNKT